MEAQYNNVPENDNQEDYPVDTAEQLAQKAQEAIRNQEIRRADMEAAFAHTRSAIGAASVKASNKSNRN